MQNKTQSMSIQQLTNILKQIELNMMDIVEQNITDDASNRSKVTIMVIVDTSGEWEESVIKISDNIDEVNFIDEESAMQDNNFKGPFVLPVDGMGTIFMYYISSLAANCYIEIVKVNDILKKYEYTTCTCLVIATNERMIYPKRQNLINLKGVIRQCFNEYNLVLQFTRYSDFQDYNKGSETGLLSYFGSLIEDWADDVEKIYISANPWTVYDDEIRLQLIKFQKRIMIEAFRNSKKRNDNHGDASRKLHETMIAGRKLENKNVFIHILKTLISMIMMTVVVFFHYRNKLVTMTVMKLRKITDSIIKRNTG